MTQWTTDEAMDLCKQVEVIAPKFGCHVALTGGLLYRPGPRKDCDILFYRIRQAGEIDTEKLFTALSAIGLKRLSGFSWCHKAEWNGKKMDCFFPEAPGNAEYP